MNLTVVNSTHYSSYKYLDFKFLFCREETSCIRAVGETIIGGTVLGSLHVLAIAGKNTTKSQNLDCNG